MWIVKTEIIILCGSSQFGRWGPVTTHERAEELLLILAARPEVIDAKIVDDADEPFLSRKQWDKLNDIEDKPTKTEDNHE